MSYLVLARKYRPQTFEEMVGQDHVSRTLTNAISIGRVAHAILFSGPRGTGKTTVARILAKAMNCKEGPTRIPCNTCRSCTEITSGRAVDVYEIDGASNNSVDQVRDLRDNVKYMPAHSRYKIYIIDEVHMLSLAAFNALLKTLEEPPGHVMFLFATTERHKIPVTILSRCQQHDLRRIDVESIADYMKMIGNKEGSDIDRESMTLIAREADGSMRDALSLLDQVLACVEGSVSYDQVVDVLGVVDRKTIFDLSTALLNGDVPELLDLVDDVYGRGHDLKKVYTDLVEHFRNLLVVKIGKKISKLVDLPQHEIERMQGQAAGVSAVFLNQVFDLLFKEETTIRFSNQPRLAIEMVFLRLLQIVPTMPIDTLIEKLDRLKSEIAGMPEAARRQTGSIGHGLENKNGRENAGESAASPGNAGASLPTGPPDAGEGKWDRFLEAVSEKHPSLGPSLGKGSLKSITGDKMVIEITGNDFTVNMIQKNLGGLRKICRDLFGPHMDIDLDIVKIRGEENKKKSSDAQSKQDALNHPLVVDALEIFDGKVDGVKTIR